MTKHEWRKSEKQYYLPKTKPEIVDVPAFNFLTIKGEGSPASKSFADAVQALYAASYTIKMNCKKMETPPSGYSDYAVYPLEGIWDINEEAKERNDGRFEKDELVYTIMIRQADFVDAALVESMLEIARKKKKDIDFSKISFEPIEDGLCMQMLHLGPFENEPESFSVMEKFAEESGYKRLSKKHREIYLSDFRKVDKHKLKTVLRFKLVKAT